MYQYIIFYITQNVPFNSLQNLTFKTVAAVNAQGPFPSTVFLKVANKTLPCTPNITVYPDPKFISFTSIPAGGNVRIIIQVKNCSHLFITHSQTRGLKKLSVGFCFHLRQRQTNWR